MARPIRIAAAGDIHCSPETKERLAEALADICASLTARVVAVLGNHDWHANRIDDVLGALERAGISVLNPGTTTCTVDGTSVGVVGTKGFVGGFPDSQLPDFGEPILRQVYRETTAEVEAIEAGLEEIAACDRRIVLLHYAPTTTTLEGEPRVIWAFLGTDRMATPIGEQRPDVVLHGHAHRGTFEGRIGEVPVYNVAVEVMQRDFFVFELDGAGLRALT
jgi:Icc-related predicted phosphoesterase